ncbi:MAG: hypothetical protein KF878_04060 [Planctomycetes bacterium]|nr:hypothetical protein [Planctomycetota bacterium]
MTRPHALGATLLAALTLCATTAHAGDEHWSRQFKKPARPTQMGPGTGMSDGHTKPSVTKVKWHEGKLWMAGAWEVGVDAQDMTRQRPNEYWHLWTWSPEAGYEPVCWFHSAQGGAGPDGKLQDFIWLPDGRLVIAGSFTRLDNPGGTRYHRVNALAVYDPKEPTADKWRPLGSFQYNGTVSEGGSIFSLAFDPQANDLYIGGTFGGIGGVYSQFIHRFDFDTNSYEPVPPGVGGAKPVIHKLWVDTSTKPSTVYVGGKFHYTAGDGQNPAVSGSTARYSTGFAAYQLGQGWTTFPRERVKEDESVLQRAADFMHFDSVHVMDFLVEHGPNGRDIWIVGAFSEGKDTGQTLRGVARWDEANQRWTDPTGKGGVGRECWNIARGRNGKLYFAGAFGGRNQATSFFQGFKDGSPAAMAMSFDPKTNTWAQLGSGLSSLVFPEVRMCVDGDDVWFVGDFRYIGPENEKKAELESWAIARWNETVDFVKSPPQVAAAPSRTPAPLETRPRATGNERWSRAFPAPPRRARPDQPAHTARTGMDIGTGTPDVSAMTWLGDTLYFGGSWQAVPNERWYVWSYHAERGWEKLGWEKGAQRTGFDTPPEGLKVRDGKLWVHGSNPTFKGVAIYDPQAKTWAPLEGTWRGKKVTGHAAPGGGTIHDVAWDGRTGDVFLVGATGLYEEGDAKLPAPVIRVDKDGAYHVMGTAFMPEDPGKPLVVAASILVDDSQTPADIYVGGTFGYRGGSSGRRADLCFNVVRWDPAQQDWVAVGKGAPAREIDRSIFPQGYPGLPALPANFLRADFPRVRCMVMDAERNIYAGGTVAVFDEGTLPVADRKESFGLVKYDRKLDRWVPATKTGGVSRDVLELRWLDEARTQLLLCGAFEYGNDWTPLNGVAIFDAPSGELRPLGGGLLRASREQVVAPMIRHAVRGDELWFAGLFDHAGVNANSRLEAPVESANVAVWHRTANLDPNRGLTVKPASPLPAATGSGSASHNVTLEAQVEGDGTITWYERGSTGTWTKKGTGPKLTASVRVAPGAAEVLFYVSVTRDGVEGGKQPVRIPVQAR